MLVRYMTMYHTGIKSLWALRSKQSCHMTALRLRADITSLIILVG